MDDKRIVVGVDGSPASLAALRWAADRAAMDAATLDVVLAYHWRLPGLRRPGRDVREAAHGLATALVQAAVDEVAPGVPAHARAVLGDAVPVLVKESEYADLLVVGSRGRGGFTGLLTGSVAAAVARHAAGPVAVVRGRLDRAVAGAPVVVGVDLGAPDDHTLATAFEEASWRHAPLAVVHAMAVPTPPWTIGVPPLGYDVRNAEVGLYRELSALTERWRDKYPDVTAECVVDRGSPGAVLTSRSAAAQLVVVGSLGLQLLHHSDCPVLIARVPLTKGLS